MIVQIVLGVLRTVPVKLAESTKKLEIEDIIKSLQTALLVSTSAILKRVSNLYDPGKDYKYTTQNKSKKQNKQKQKAQSLFDNFFVFFEYLIMSVIIYS